MDFVLTEEIETDVREMEIEFRKNLQPWWDELSVYLPKPGEDMGFQMLPVMVIQAYRWIGHERKLAVRMANLFRTINFANLIHLRIHDSGEGQQHNQDLQFTILIGDYIFGLVLRLLLETNAERLLDQFSAMICNINEGFVMQYNLGADLEESLNKTRVPFYTNAFSSAAELKEWSPQDNQLYSNLGQNLGMALELIYVHDKRDRGLFYLDKAESLYKQLSQTRFTSNNDLETVFNAIRACKGSAVNGI